MKIVVNNVDVYDVGHDTSLNEYIVYVCTDDNVIVTAVADVIGQGSLSDTVNKLTQKYNIDDRLVTYIPYNKSFEDVIGK